MRSRLLFSALVAIGAAGCAGPLFRARLTLDVDVPAIRQGISAIAAEIAGEDSE
jgi:hypothetical protein